MTATLAPQRYTVAEIREKLASNDMWVVNGIMAIYGNQTVEEQNADATIEDNGIGFNGVDAEILSSFANQIQEWRDGKSPYRFPLSGPQLKIARKKMAKYAGQLAKLAKDKPTPPPRE
jgi:hypothetical protein